MPVDPIAEVVTALSSVLVAPNPALPASPKYGPVSKWEGTSANPGTFFNPLQTLLGVFFAASTDINTVGKSIHKALTDVAQVVTVLADNLAKIDESLSGNATQALGALQSGLSLAQALAPGNAMPVLNSASALFEKLNQLLEAAGSIDKASAELAELSQQLTKLSELFPS